MKPNLNLRRRTALKLLAGTSVAGLAGCLDGPPSGAGSPGGPLTDVEVKKTSLVVTLAADAGVDQVNVIAPKGALFSKRSIETGATSVSFELGTAYEPGEFRVLALNAEETIDEATIEIRPELRIVDIGLYRNRPEKDWNAVYGESSTDRRKNSEAFVTVENTGSGPERITQLRFTGDIPHLARTYQGSGLYGKNSASVFPGQVVDLYSETLPFGYNSSPEGMGCDPTGVAGKFTVTIHSQVLRSSINETFKIHYSGSESMHDCEISIDEV